MYESNIRDAMIPACIIRDSLVKILTGRELLYALYDNNYVNLIET